MPKEKYEKPGRQHTYMSAADVAAGKPSTWQSIEITGSVRNVCPQLFHFQHITSLFLNDNHLVELPPDVCQLIHLNCLDVSSNKLRSIPAEVGDLSELRELLLSNNQLRSLPLELGKLFQLQNLDIKYNPLPAEIFQLNHSMSGTQKLISYMFERMPRHRTIISERGCRMADVSDTGCCLEKKGKNPLKFGMGPPMWQVTTTAPPPRRWIVQQSSDPSLPAAVFTVMCYNVLCDKYCTRQQYAYCPQWALNWVYRRKGILQHILDLHADIISLQEVETDQFYHFFLPELKREGYDGIFSPKSRARTMTEQERKHVDGCAIFFKKDKFRLLEEKLVEFNQLAMANADGNDDMLNRVMTKDNIGLCALLETKPAIFDSCPRPPEPMSRQLLLVATAHIHWDPEYSDVKMVQTMMLMWELQKFVEEATHKYNLPFTGPINCNSIPLVFCGDLNSLPDSGVIEFLTNGKVAANHEDFKDNMYDQVMKKMCNGDKSHIYHNFELARAYNDIMPVTNYTYDFKGIIDYIFYSKTRLKVLGQLGPYDEEWFRHNKVLGCPHPHIPSDHFSLLVELEMPIQPPIMGRGLHPLGSKSR